ncbi:hypothetical protein Xoosp13_93 [Xanthomonas phage Xoo-sp13]|nr:hypothetical protein Xoosp13_93 [Xanthomonas phage Xoo-sp13]
MSTLGLDFAPSHKSTRTVTIARQAYLELLHTELEPLKLLRDARELEIETWISSPERKEEAKKLLVQSVLKTCYSELVSFTLKKYLYPKLNLFQKVKWNWGFAYTQKVDYAESVGFNYPVEGFYKHYSYWMDNGLQQVYGVYQEYADTNLTYDEFAQQLLDEYMAKHEIEAWQVVCRLNHVWHHARNVYSDKVKTIETLAASIDKVTDATFTISENEFINLTK